MEFVRKCFIEITKTTRVDFGQTAGQLCSINNQYNSCIILMSNVHLVYIELHLF